MVSAARSASWDPLRATYFAIGRAGIRTNSRTFGAGLSPQGFSWRGADPSPKRQKAQRNHVLRVAVGEAAEGVRSTARRFGGQIHCSATDFNVSDLALTCVSALRRRAESMPNSV
jgi:hypothetical protein